jgi:peroxisomal 3,2-trans-enoyl-CoA isomerase
MESSVFRFLKHKAMDILVFNRKITAQEAYERNIVSEIIPELQFQSEVWKKIESFSKLPKQVSR